MDGSDWGLLLLGMLMGYCLSEVARAIKLRSTGQNNYTGDIHSQIAAEMRRLSRDE